MTDDRDAPPADDGDEADRYSLQDRVLEQGEEVQYLIWEADAPGYSGSTRIYALDGAFYVIQDGEFHGPFASIREAEGKFDVFSPVDEADANDDVVIEIWSKEHGVHYQKKSLWPLTDLDCRFDSRWVIDGRVVTEPWVGGERLGELPDYDTKGARLVHLSQAEYDELRQEFRREHGHYPDP